MSLPRRVRILGATLVGCAVLKLAATAAACSPPQCTSPLRLPPSHWMPGNLVYFKLLDDTEVELALRTAAGDPIAAGIRTIGNDRVFAPEAPIAAGTEVVLEYFTTCTLAGQPQLFEFTAEPHASIELEPAELEVVEQGIAYPGIPNNEASFVRLRHYSGDLNGAASTLMTHTFTVDGVPARLGEVNSQQVVEISARCNPSDSENQQDTCGTNYSVTPGVHLVEARTTIVGEVNQPEPARLTVDVRCPGDVAQPTPDRTLDSDSTANFDADFYRPTTTRGELPSLATESASPDGAPASAGGGGCALAHRAPHRTSATLAAGFGVLLLAASVARRRRRA